MGCQGVVDGNGDAAQTARSTSEEATDLCFKGKVATLVFGDLHPVDPLKRKKLDASSKIHQELAQHSG